MHHAIGMRVETSSVWIDAPATLQCTANRSHDNTRVYCTKRIVNERTIATRTKQRCWKFPSANSTALQWEDPCPWLCLCLWLCLFPFLYHGLCLFLWSCHTGISPMEPAMMTMRLILFRMVRNLHGGFPGLLEVRLVLAKSHVSVGTLWCYEMW